MTELRTSRRTFNHIKPPRFAFLTPLIWLLILATFVSSGYGAYQQLKPSTTRITAVVDGDLPLHINQQTVDAAFDQTPAYYPEKIVVGVTSQPKGSDGLRSFMEGADADIVLSMDPETGWSSLVPSEMDFSHGDWADYQAYPYDKWGISINPHGDLSHYSTEAVQDIELSIVKNTMMGHGAKTIQAIATQIDKQHSFEKENDTFWLWFALVPLLLALLLTLRHIPRNRRYQNTYYRFAKANSLLNMVVLNIDLVEAALTIDQQSKSQNRDIRAIDALDQKIFEAQAAQEKLTALIGSRHKMLQKEQQLQIETFEKSVKTIVEDYNKIAISTGIVNPQENRYSHIYGINSNSEHDYLLDQPQWKLGCWGILGLFIIANTLVGILCSILAVQYQHFQRQQLASTYPVRDHQITQVKYVGNPDDLTKYFSSYHEKYSVNENSNDPIGRYLDLYPEESNKGGVKIEAGSTKFFEQDATMVVVPLGKNLNEVFSTDFTAYEKGDSQYPKVSSVKYLQYLQEVKVKLGDEFVDPTTFEIKDNVIVVPSAYRSDSASSASLSSFDVQYLPPLIGMVKDYGNHYYDTGFLLMADGGSNIIIFPELYPHLSDYQQMFTRDIGTVQTWAQTKMFFLYAALNWGLVLIVYLGIRNSNGAIIAGYKARRAYKSDLVATRGIIHKLALELDNARLNSLLLADGAAPGIKGSTAGRSNDAKRAEYESALAEAWYHLQVLESVPQNLRATPTLQTEVDQLLKEAKNLEQWNDGVAEQTQLRKPKIDQKRK